MPNLNKMNEKRFKFSLCTVYIEYCGDGMDVKIYGPTFNIIHLQTKLSLHYTRTNYKTLLLVKSVRANEKQMKSILQ